MKENEIFILTRLKDKDGRRMEDFYFIIKPGEQFYGLSYEQLRANGDREIEVDPISLPIQ
jgi:hypothetical protein